MRIENKNNQQTKEDTSVVKEMSSIRRKLTKKEEKIKESFYKNVGKKIFEQQQGVMKKNDDDERLAEFMRKHPPAYKEYGRIKKRKLEGAEAIEMLNKIRNHIEKSLEKARNSGKPVSSQVLEAMSLRLGSKESPNDGKLKPWGKIGKEIFRDPGLVRGNFYDGLWALDKLDPNFKAPEIITAINRLPERKFSKRSRVMEE